MQKTRQLDSELSCADSRYCGKCGLMDVSYAPAAIKGCSPEARFHGIKLPWQAATIEAMSWTTRPSQGQHLAAYAANMLDRLVARPVAHPGGRVLLMQIKAWRVKFFVFLENRDVPATNNISEREIRPSVVFCKVTNGFRSDWGAQVHAGYRSGTGAARPSGQSALSAIRELVDSCFSPA